MCMPEALVIIAGDPSPLSDKRIAGITGQGVEVYGQQHFGCYLSPTDQGDAAAFGDR